LTERSQTKRSLNEETTVKTTMFDYGYFQTFQPANSMSALPPKADIQIAVANVRK